MSPRQAAGERHARHRHQECPAFLRRLDRSYDPDLNLRLIVDDYGTHTHPDVRAWLEKHPRFALHFTPTSASWLNLVKRWLRELTTRRIRRRPRFEHRRQSRRCDPDRGCRHRRAIGALRSSL